MYNVFLAQNTTDALIKLKAIPRPDLIISDIMMDGPDGFQLLIALSEEEGYNDIPFIFLTALGREKNKLMGLQLGAVDYIEKPFSISAIKAKIESIITLRKRQAKQDLISFRNRFDELFSGSQIITKGNNNLRFNRLCNKYGIIGREREILRLLMNGLVHKEIATSLNLTRRTIEYHITKIYKKCGVNNKFDLLKKIQE